MSTAAAGGYEGGAGGKFRKRPFRRQTTPYDRPVTALRNPVEGGNNNGWLSKIVDPASRIIARSAQSFFSSVFRKRLPAPETVSEVDRELYSEPTEAVSALQNPFEVQEPVVNGSDDQNNHSDSSGIGELEQILKQKKFTRAEIDRLTELLRSRTVDVPAEDEKKRSEPSTSQPVAHNLKVEAANVLVQENGLDTQRLLGEASAPAVSSSVLEEDIASPAELAKAYMGSRPSKVSPSTLGLRSLREEVPLLSNVPFPRKSSGMSLVPRSSVRSARIPGVSENGYQTPKSRGRSAIYSMARTPYSRIHPTAKGIGDTDDQCAGPSTSPWTLESSMISTGKQVSKRRSLVLDNDIGSVGPIRRIRQKTNLMSPKSIGLLAPETPIPARGTALGSDFAQGSVSLTQKPLLLEEPRHNTPKMRIAEDWSNSIPGMSFASVPSQSSEMAEKILQQLDKLVPSPKEKSSKLKLATAREKSATKLSLNMLHGQDFWGVDEVDSSKSLNNIQSTGNLNAVGSAALPVIQNSAYRKLDKVEENGWLKIAGSGNKLASEANGTEKTGLKKDTVPNFRTAESVISNSVVTHPQKKQAFQMIAHEDSLELVNDCRNTKGVHTADGKEKLDDATVEENKSVAAETVTVEKPPISEIKTPASLILNKSSGTGASDAPVTSLLSTVAQPATLCKSPPLFGNVVPTKGPPASSPMFNFGPEVLVTPTPFTFSSVSSFSESSGQKFGARSGSKLDTSSSPATVGASVTEVITKAAVSDTGGKEIAVKTGDLFGKHENSTFSSVSTSATSSTFSFNNSKNNSNLSNGSIALSTSLFSVPASSVPASTISANVSFENGPATTGCTTTGSLSASAASAFSSVPIFQFGSSTTITVASSSSMSQPSTSGAESTDLEQKAERALPFGSLSPLPFGATSSSLTSTGSGIFGFSNVAPASTTTSSTSANHLSSDTFGAGTEPLFGLQTASRAVTSSFTQSIPSQLGPSAASPALGLSGSSTSSGGSSLFGSSSSASKLFSSGAGFGQNSSTTFSMGANSFSNASLFSSSSLPESSVIGTVLSSASSPASGFSFGGSSITAAASVSASSPAAVFSFGGSSTAGAASVSASSPAAGFSFGGSSTAGAATVIASPTTGFSFGGSSTGGLAIGSAPMGFGSGIGASSGSVFSFTSASSPTLSASLTSSQPVFSVPNPSITFGSSSPANDQMNMEDSMAEDTVQASTPTVSPFGQPATTPSPGFMFNSAPSGAPFQFGAQQNPAAPQNSSPFQAANFDFAPGGSFSLGTGDKSNRKIFRAKRDKMRKK